MKWTKIYSTFSLETEIQYAGISLQTLMRTPPPRRNVLVEIYLSYLKILLLIRSSSQFEIFSINQDSVRTVEI